MDQAALPPSEWVMHWMSCLPTGGRILDVACGSGRHTRMLAQAGYRVEAVDRDLSSLGEIAGFPGVAARQLDLEASPWPYGAAAFDGIVVTNYLHRPLFPHLLASLSPGGVLIYETFAQGNEAFGKPSNPVFLLKPGELLEWVHGCLRVLAYEDIFVSRPKAAMIQRICAVRPN